MDLPAPECPTSATSVPSLLRLASKATTISAPATIEIVTDAVDEDGSITKVDFYAGTTHLSTDTSAPYVFTWKDVPAGEYFLQVVAYDNFGAYDSEGVNIVVLEGQSCAEAGQIQREQWNGIEGTSIASIPTDADSCEQRRPRPALPGRHAGGRMNSLLILIDTVLNIYIWLLIASAIMAAICIALCTAFALFALVAVRQHWLA